MSNQITPQQARTLRISLDLTLLETVVNDLPKAYGFLGVKVPGYKIIQFLKEQVGEPLEFWAYDGFYWLLPFRDWQEAIGTHWLTKQKYVGDKFDCDNFALLFSSWSALTLNVNSGFTVRGEYYYTDGQLISGHLWNGIVSLELDGTMKLWWYEPQTGTYQEHIKGQKKFQMGQRLYEPTYFIGF